MSMCLKRTSLNAKRSIGKCVCTCIGFIIALSDRYVITLSSHVSTLVSYVSTLN